MRKMLVACLAFVCTTACTSDQSIPETILGAKPRAARNWDNPQYFNRSNLGLVGPIPHDYQQSVRDSYNELMPGKVRIPVKWGFVENGTPGGRDQSYLHEIHLLVNKIRAIGATPYINFVDTPGWVRNCQVEEQNGDPCPYGGYSSPPLYSHDADFNQYISDMVQEFGPTSGPDSTVEYFGIFNEPNAPSFSTFQRENDPMLVYSHFANNAAYIIKTYGGKVVGPELAGGYWDTRRPAGQQNPERWIADYMSYGAGWITDIISIHAYAGTGEPYDPNPGVDVIVANHLDPAKNWNWPYGNWRLWVTESGTAQNFRSTPDGQARWTVKAFSDFYWYRVNHPNTRWDALFPFMHWVWAEWATDGDGQFALLNYGDENNLDKEPGYWCYNKIAQGISPLSLSPPNC
jgi:hypothetical protein